MSPHMSRQPSVLQTVAVLCPELQHNSHIHIHAAALAYASVVRFADRRLSPGLCFW
jgi:hypothetical protein